MRSDTQQTNRRRGGRRPSRGPRSSSSANGSSVAKKPAKLGFFERILAFFTGKNKTNGKARTAAVPVNSLSSANGRSKIRIESEPKPQRKPELIEVTSPKVYVGNLSFDAVESDLTNLFNGVGSVTAAEVVSHRETQKSKGFAFVTMASVDEAKRAVSELHDKEFMGRHLVVSGAKTNDVRDAR